MVDLRMEKARSRLIIDHPFLGALSLYLQMVEDPLVETMSTNGSELRYAPAFLDSISRSVIEGVVAHEVFHCAYRHHLRRGNRDVGLWNEACDYIVNRDLRKLGFKLPDGHLYDPQYNGLGEEEVYARLTAKQKEQQQQQGQEGDTQPQSSGEQEGQSKGSGDGDQPPAGDPNRGTGKGKGSGQPQNGSPATPAEACVGDKPGDTTPGQPGKAELAPKQGTRKLQQPGHVVDGVDTNDTTEKAEQEVEWKRRVQEALNVAKASNAGNLPGGLEDLAKTNSATEIDWRETLRRFIDSKVVTDYSWTNPNKRFLSSGYVLPGIRADGVNRLGVAIDTSGSVSNELLDQFLSEITAAMDLGCIQDLVLVQCDTRVNKVDVISKGDDIDVKVYGRGGTKFSPAFEWFSENEPDVAGIVYFSDMECGDYGEEPACPVLWIAYGPTSVLDQYTRNVPFGEVVRIDNPN